ANVRGLTSRDEGGATSERAPVGASRRRSDCQRPSAGWRLARKERPTENVRRWRLAPKERPTENVRRWRLAPKERPTENVRRWRLAPKERPPASVRWLAPRADGAAGSEASAQRMEAAVRGSQACRVRALRACGG